MYQDEYKKTTQSLILRLVFAAILCVGIFSVLAFFTSKKNTETIETVGDIYMHGISEEIALHFKTTIDSQFNLMVDLMAAADMRNPGEEETGRVKEWLAEGAAIRNLSCLAFCSADGELDVFYGSSLELDDTPSFLAALRGGERAITSGADASGNRLLLMGLPGDALIGAETSAVALVSGIPVGFISDTLSLDVSDSPAYSHIIRRDGSFVIRNGDAFRDSYFDRVSAEVDGGGAKYVAAMRDAMERGEHFSAILGAGGDQRHVHITELPYADWFLVVVMPYSSADTDISRLTAQSLYVTYAGAFVVLLVLLWIFRSYFKELKRQMLELDRVRQDAVDANRSKSTFLSNMSHDIRTPMNAIVGMTSIATANIDNKEQVESCLRKITLSSKHLLSLINDVLDISKIESGKMTLSVEQVSLREVIENVITIIQPQVEAKKQVFDVVTHDICAEDVCCDAVRLNQVLINILGNAVKFTPEGGSIQVTVYEEDAPMPGFTRTHIIVTDTGMGMTPEFKERIFESFSRADGAQVHRTEGSGLGMAITKHIIDAMQGVIEVQSELGKGSSFHIVLDLEKAQVQERDMALPSCRALVVDDDLQVCESTVATLRELGLDADWALDAEDALQMIGRRHETSDEYLVLLVDWKLPQMDGIELAREVRFLYGNEIPILLISACDWSGLEAEAAAAGVTGFISKPLFKSTLFQRLKPLLLNDMDAAPNTQEDADNFNGKRVLLAEDNELNWEIASELLSDLGLELDWAQNGQVCLDKFRQSDAGYYTAVLMDVRMPIMSGHEAARAIRGLSREDAQTIPIIAMTADAFAEDIKECLRNGMNAHIAKPIDIREITKLLKKYIA